MQTLDIGKRLKRLREWRNYTQTHLAYELNISQATYSRIENGTVELTTSQLFKIAIIFNVSTPALLTSNTEFAKELLKFMNEEEAVIPS